MTHPRHPRIDIPPLAVLSWALVLIIVGAMHV